MTEVNQASRTRLIKTLAVFGFVAAVVFLVWLAIQIVSLLPGAFASLASLAESINDRERTTDAIVLNETSGVANSQESFTQSWPETKKKGHYTISYNCAEGVSLDIRLPNGNIVEVPCGENYRLPDNAFSIDMAFTSTETRFVDVDYTIAFVPSGKEEPSSTASKTLTLVNPTIPAAGLVASATDSEDEEEMEEETPAPTNNTPPTNTNTGGVSYVYTTTYKVPVNDPNGYTDLSVSFLSVGVISGSGKYTPTGKLDNNDTGAFQFKVKNIGTKTSTNWQFVADLPDDIEYKSATQIPLKPNEEQTVTLSFGKLDDGTEKFGVTVLGGADTKTANNSFTSSVKVD